MELAKKYRPSTPKQVVGQPAVMKSLGTYLKTKTLPQFLLFTGDSGCGKTTIARILSNAVGCKSDFDLQELNAAENRGIDMVRDIKNRMNFKPTIGDARVWIVDESHQLTRDAQQALLKVLEEPPSWVYFFFCTTEPQKLLPTIVNRATVFKLKALQATTARKLVSDVAAKERIALDDEVLQELVAQGNGSPRRLLVLLDRIAQLKSVDDQLEALKDGTLDASEGVIKLCRELMAINPSWPKITEILSSLEEEPEQVRWNVLGYAQSIMLRKGAKNINIAALVIDAFSVPFYDTKKAGLVLAAYQVFKREI